MNNWKNKRIKDHNLEGPDWNWWVFLAQSFSKACRKSSNFFLVIVPAQLACSSLTARPTFTYVITRVVLFLHASCAEEHISIIDTKFPFFAEHVSIITKDQVECALSLNCFNKLRSICRLFLDGKDGLFSLGSFKPVFISPTFHCPKRKQAPVFLELYRAGLQHRPWTVLSLRFCFT